MSKYRKIAAIFDQQVFISSNVFGGSLPFRIAELRRISTPRMFICFRWLCLAVCIAFACAQEDGTNVTNEGFASGHCGMSLIWPLPDAIILVAPDSLYLMIYLKVWGNCAEFLLPISPTRYHLKFAYIIYGGHSGPKADLTLLPLRASPLAEDPTPVNLRLQRSPLLGDSRAADWSGNSDHSSAFSVWSVHLFYSEHMLNIYGIHEPDHVFMTMEFHLVSNMSTPVASLSRPSAVLRFRLLGFSPSSFFRVIPKYTTIPGFGCQASHSRRTTESAICTRITRAMNWTLPGPSFSLLSIDAGGTITARDRVTSFSRLCMSTFNDDCPGEVAYVSIGDGAHGHEMSVVGPGRHRLLSVIATAITDSVGYIFIKTSRVRIDHSHVLKVIRKFDLISSYAFIAFRHVQRRYDRMEVEFEASDSSYPFPAAAFGSVYGGILLSRAAAELMLTVASDEADLKQDETVPAACSEFLIFSDAWLCWCAASLDIPAIDVTFTFNFEGKNDPFCPATSSLYGKLAQLYEQQRLSASSTVSPPFTERTTLGFHYFMQTLVFHLVSGPRILDIPDDEKLGDSMFWDSCCGKLLGDYMLVSRHVSAGLHPQLQSMRGALASAPNRSAFVHVMRAAVIADSIEGRDSVNSSMHAVRRRLRTSVSAARVLGCSVHTISSRQHTDGDSLLGSSGSSVAEPLQLHIITPAVVLSVRTKPISRRLYLAIHSNWSDVFGYNPLFSKSASLAFDFPDFGVQDWHLFCMLAVSSMEGSGAFIHDLFSRQYLACDAFASAVWQRTYAAGMLRCFDLPPHVLGDVRYARNAWAIGDYWRQCQDQNIHVEDDPWKLRHLAEEVLLIQLERWNAEQVCKIRFRNNSQFISSFVFNIFL
jgi:hypothetical protein